MSTVPDSCCAPRDSRAACADSRPPRGQRARAPNGRKQKTLRDRPERSANSRDIFVIQHRKNNCGAPIAERFPPGFGQGPRASRVMSSVDNGSRVPVLESRRPFDGGQPALDRRIVHRDSGRVQSGERKRSVLFLVGSRQGNWKALKRLPNEIERS